MRAQSPKRGSPRGFRRTSPFTPGACVRVGRLRCFLSLPTCVTPPVTPHPHTSHTPAHPRTHPPTRPPIANSPVAIADVPGLPDIDVVVISHNHYDHLDQNTVRALAKRPHAPERAPLWLVPLGMKQFMTDCGVQNCVEMDWTERVTVQDPTALGRPPLTVSALPCQHWCARGILDRNRCLWCAWHATTDNGSYFFGGDTGYCGDVFKQVGHALGPVDLAALPIGAYGAPNEQWFHKPMHMNPDDAVRTHQVRQRAKESRRRGEERRFKLCCTVLYCIILHCTVLYCIVL